MKKLLATLWCLMIPVTALCAADDGKGRIDWNGGFVVATGYGTADPRINKAKARNMALRAAEVSAQRALLETIKGVRISSQTTVENSMLTEDVIKSRVDGIVKGAIVTKRDVETVDGAPLATVEMKVCMSGGPAECASKPTLVHALSLENRPVPAFVPAKTLVECTLPDAAKTSPPSAGNPQVSSEHRPPQYDNTKPVTGIVFHLDGRYFERELLPVVITTAAGESVTVYSVKMVKPSIVRTYGAVRYADTLDLARQNQSAGANPMIVMADGVTKENMILIRSDDARVIKETCSHGNNYLGDAKVVISIR